MNTSLKTGAVLLAGILALAACSSSEGEGAAAEPSSSSSVSASSDPALSAAATTPAPAGESSAAAERYAQKDLEAALAAVGKDRGLSGEVRGADALRPKLDDAAGKLAGVVITPAQCQALAVPEFVSAVDQANVAVLPLSGTEVLVASSHEDPAELEEQMQEVSSSLKECAEFRLEAEGLGLTATSRQIEAATDAESTLAHRVDVSGFGQSAEILQVAGVSGHTNIQVLTVGVDRGEADPSADADKAEGLINAVLAELEQK